MPNLIRPILYACLIALSSPGCAEDAPHPRAPVIDDLRPAAAEAGAEVAIVGRRVGIGVPRDGVWMGGKNIPVESWSDGLVLLRVPPRIHGVTFVVIRSGPWVSAPRSFEVLPTIRGTDGPGDAHVGDLAP